MGSSRLGAGSLLRIRLPRPARLLVYRVLLRAVDEPAMPRDYRRRAAVMLHRHFPEGRRSL